MHLLDTNILSELTRKRPDAGVARWVGSQTPGALFISAATIGEVSHGIEKIRPKDAARAQEIEQWLLASTSIFGILPATEDIFRIWGRLMAATSGHHAIDAIIAATAIKHDLVLVTRNSKDFRTFGVRLLNPFDPAR